LPSFNRTILELKHAERQERYVDELTAFNRTILELKHTFVVRSWRVRLAFNRTILELKQWYKVDYSIIG